MKCPDCGAKAKYDHIEDVFYCTFCLWDEVLDGLPWSA